MRNILTILEETAARYPRRTAFSDESGGMCYAALLSRARAIGSMLLSLPPQSPVLIYMEKSAASVAAMLGAAYAGCFYVPVDPDMPAARLRLIADTLRPACALCDAKYLDHARTLCENARTADDLTADIDDAGLSARRRQAIDADLLYVLFTSGSTGAPKGVSVSHRAVIDFVEWACAALPIDGDCVFGNQAPLYFDNSVLDIYCAMRVGARVHFIPRKYFLFPGKMPEYLKNQAINTLFWVPSALTSLARAGDKLRETGLRNVFFCGEVMPCKTLNLLKNALPRANYINMYGPTEITDVCMAFPVTRDFADDDALPIGFPCANARVYLIDGEICVAGTCLANGYYGDPEKTRAAFVVNPLRPETNEIIYKTGDLGAYNERGEMLFIGRRDSQIKRHGYRIELGEIECALCAVAGVDKGVCLYSEQDEKIVCVYAGARAEKDVLRAIKETIPKYMLPDVLKRRDSLPETGNGKIDRALMNREWRRARPADGEQTGAGG